MQEVEFRFNLHGYEIFGFHVRPAIIKGIVVLVHGFGEHSGRYKEHVIPILLKSGLAVITYDNIGHGKSGGKRGHCPSYGALLDLLGEVIRESREEYPDEPVFLYGHSMGGNLVLNYALRKDFDLAGVIATSPYLRLAFEPPKWKMVIGKLMFSIMPSITLPSGLDPKAISRIPEEVKKYQDDQLIFDVISPMYSFPVMEAGEWAIANAHLLSCDTLLFHGAGDQIIACNGTEEFHKNANTTTFKLFDRAYHELHNDFCRDEMLTILSHWLQERI